MKKNKKDPAKVLTKKDEIASEEKDMPTKSGRTTIVIIVLLILFTSLAAYLHYGTEISFSNNSDAENVIDITKQDISVKRNLASQSSQINLKYPLDLAPRGDTVDTYMDNDGETEIKVQDPYRSLEDTQSTSTIKWVNAQNKITNDFFSKIPLRNKIKEKFTKLWDRPSQGMPTKHGN